MDWKPFIPFISWFFFHGIHYFFKFIFIRRKMWFMYRQTPYSQLLWYHPEKINIGLHLWYLQQLIPFLVKHFNSPGLHIKRKEVDNRFIYDYPLPGRVFQNRNDHSFYWIRQIRPSCKKEEKSNYQDADENRNKAFQSGTAEHLFKRLEFHDDMFNPV